MVITKIYFDTNILECRKDKYVKLDNQFLGPDFFMVYNELKSREELSFVIPRIVQNEMIQHMRESYQANIDSIKSKMASVKEIFGENIRFDLQLYKDEQEYVDNFNAYIKKLANENKNLVLTEEALDLEKIVQRSVIKRKPFMSATGNKKLYSDAGFKDVLLYHTILSNCEKENIILYTKDRDFDDIAEEKIAIKVMHSKEELFEELMINQKMFKVELMVKGPYFKEDILSQLNIDGFNFDIDTFTVEKCTKNVDENYEIIVKIDFNQAIYDVKLILDSASNVIQQFEYKIRND